MNEIQKTKGFASYEEWMKLLDRAFSSFTVTDHRNRPWVLLAKEKDGFLVNCGLFATKSEAEEWKREYYASDSTTSIVYKGYPHYE